VQYMVYLTDDLDFALSLTGGLPLMTNFSVDVSQVKDLLKHEYRSCVIRKFSAKKLTELLGCDIPMYQKDLFRIKEGDTIIYFYAEIWFRDDEVLSKEEIQQLLFKFSGIKIEDVVGIKEDEVKYYH